MPLTVNRASATARPSRLPLTAALPLAAILLGTALLCSTRYTHVAASFPDSPAALISDDTEYLQDTPVQNPQFYQQLADRARSHASISHSQENTPAPTPDTLCFA